MHQFSKKDNMSKIQVVKCIESMLSDILFQQKLIQEKFDYAHKEGQWSQLSGFYGIKTGLIIAENRLREELKNIEREL
jgi:hypothetical protein